MSAMEGQGLSNSPLNSDQVALDTMVERTYSRIKQIAARMPGVKPGTSVSPTVVANETYLKFLRSKNSHKLAHQEIIGLFVRLMEEILVDLARRRSAQKRGSGQRPAALSSEIAAKLADPKTRSASPEDVLTVRDAIQKLRITNSRWAEIVERRYYLGLTMEELSKLLTVSVSTLEREHKEAMKFLTQAIGKREAQG
jgi:RNA polymerase sigma factor (TIGR02999 family)